MMNLDYGDARNKNNSTGQNKRLVRDSLRSFPTFVQYGTYPTHT